jgi:hypothetical protein
VAKTVIRTRSSGQVTTGNDNGGREVLPARLELPRLVAECLPERLGEPATSARQPTAGSDGVRCGARIMNEGSNVKPIGLLLPDMLGDQRPADKEQYLCWGGPLTLLQ